MDFCPLQRRENMMYLAESNRRIREVSMSELWHQFYEPQGIEKYIEVVR